MAKLSKSIIKYLAFAILTTSTSFLAAQTNEGTNFWFGFMEHINPRLNTKVVLITSKVNTSGTITIPGLGFTQTFNVIANDVTSIEMPLDTEFIGSEFVQDIAINVTSVEPISVYIHQYHSARSEATVVLPVSTISNEYFIMSYTGINNGFVGTGFSEFMIVATEDETTVNYTLTDQTKGGALSGSSQTVTLHQGQSYQVQAAQITGDLTGTFVSADKRIAVFSGASFSGVPMNCGSHDNLLEMMPPLDTWGTRFVSVPTNDGDFDVFRVLASENGTTVTVFSQGGTPTPITLNRGEFREYTSFDATYIEADKPIIVTQYLIGQDCTSPDDLQGDPSMLVLNSVEQIRDTVTLFNSNFQAIETQFINIICRIESVDLVTFDGSLIQGGLGFQFTPIGPDDAFAFVRIPTSRGAHTIIDPGCGVIATAYGFGERETYAYSGGASFSRINANSLPEGGCRGIEITFNSGLPPERYELEWDIGDGQATRTDDNFVHTYDELGVYPAQLRIFDRCFDERDTFDRDMIVSLRQAVDAIDMIEVCEDDQIIFEVEDSGIDVPPGGRVSFEWNGPLAYFAEEQFPIIESAQPDMTGTYEVIGIVSGCETFPDSTDLIVNPTPQHDLGPDDVICDKNNKIPVLNGGDFVSYLWSTGDTEQFIDGDEEGTYTLEFIDEEGCVGMDSISLLRQCPTEIYMANVFTPQGSDLAANSTFGVLGEDIISFEFRVFDRWGNKVFRSTSQEISWDGIANNKFAEQGNYSWVLLYEGFREDGTQFEDKLTGTVLLLRE